MSKIVCTTCNKRLQQHRPTLICSICRAYKHYKCSNLTKGEAVEIAGDSQQSNCWVCQDCYTSIFPGNMPYYNTHNIDHTSQNCGACDKICSTKTSRTSICKWCDKACHKRCIKGDLGCTACCKSLIPGYSYEPYQLAQSAPSSHSPAFTPYNRDSLVNQIGNVIDTENENAVWTEISDLMDRCKYRDISNISNPRKDELRILSLNIRSLTKHVEYLRENLNQFEKFDILCFNETNCDVDTLPNAYNDITIENFHKPVLQSPYRASNRGGGLAIYVHTRVCDETDLGKLSLELEPPPNTHDNSRSTPCEHLFVKLSLNLSNKCTKT